ncbi:hypothetical protein J7T55_008009 [Diaporthe amygdali]|uniref:uncharacterized protein n=1 Tax=Phomopsis amygdali TaxID=1214568 RepID=UPI0022FED74D|nr:uncharacterized protein J7T55_008009 [Diaporthe amygdali]KAJ0114174.1 hypothetical protein J7T55_008009 [Diaporthe amygdali]
MKVPSGLACLFALGLIRDVFARISIRHCECQTPPNKLKDVNDDLIASMLDGTLSWPKDNDTTASCCQSIHTPGENVCSIQKDLTQGTHNAAFEFLKCCYFDKTMLADCFD